MARVLITGAAKRIGASFARGFAADGWHVLVHYNSSSNDAAALAADITQAGGHCDILQANLDDQAAVEKLIPAAVARWGKIDCLINNASSFGFDTIATMTAPSWESQMAPNLRAPLFLAQAFAAQLGDNTGNIINVVDHKTTSLNPDYFSYTVAKIGMAGATRLLAMAFRGRIRSNAIAPGLTMISDRQTQAQFERAWRRPPLGRSSTPEELLNAARYILATPSLNGQMLVLDGGDSLVPRARDVSFDPALLATPD